MWCMVIRRSCRRLLGWRSARFRRSTALVRSTPDTTSGAATGPGLAGLNRLTVGLEDHVIAVSDAVKRSMPASLDVEVLIHGIDIEAVAAQKVHRGAVRHELGIADDEIVIGIVANFRKEKACDVLPRGRRQGDGWQSEGSVCLGGSGSARGRDPGPSRTAGAGGSVPDPGVSRRRHSRDERVRHLHHWRRATKVCP